MCYGRKDNNIIPIIQIENKVSHVKANFCRITKIQVYVRKVIRIAAVFSAKRHNLVMVRIF